jgi:hypothetical integral membrane protein (TIGR02206 family)
LSAADPSRFVLFGLDHLAALALTALLAVGASLAVRHRPTSPLADALRFGFAGLLLVGVAGYLVSEARSGRLTPWDLLPLHLCDFLIFVAIHALLTRNRVAAELLYFWAGAGTLLAMLVPDVHRSFPNPRFIIFFGFHGAVVTAAAFVAFGLRLTPRPGAARRVFLLTLGYAAVVGVVDALSGFNFLFLRAKPAAATLLDWLGPWPWYLVSAAALAFVLFQLLALPFRAHPGLVASQGAPSGRAEASIR